MKLTFTQKEFDKFRSFQESFALKMGEQSYVGTDHACVMVEFSSELKSMLRPYPSENHYCFELRALKCEDCPKYQPFLCAKNETTYLCGSCALKREQKKQKERERQQKQKDQTSS